MEKFFLCAYRVRRKTELVFISSVTQNFRQSISELTDAKLLTDYRFERKFLISLNYNS